MVEEASVDCFYELHCFFHAVELAELAACLGLLAAFFHAWFFIILPALQLSFNSIDLKLFLQLPDGKFEITSDLNFYHLNLRFSYSSAFITNDSKRSRISQRQMTFIKRYSLDVK